MVDEKAPTTPSSAPKIVQPPSERDLGMESGVDNNLPFTMPYRSAEGKSQYELFKDESEGNGPTVAQLQAMRRMDGQARALYRLLTLPIRAALNQSVFLPAEGGEAEAEFITNVFTLPPQNGGMSVTFHRFMAQLLGALFTGFSAFEQVYWQPDKGPLAGKYTLKKLAYRPSETITFLVDETGGFAGLRQRAHMNGKLVDISIPADRSFYYAAQEEERKFYGVSFFQSAFYHYDKKMKMYYIAHLAAQRAAVGTRVGTVPAQATNAEKAKFYEQLGNLSVAQYMTHPENFKVEVLKEAGAFQFLEYINHHNSQMSKSLLASFFDQDRGGSENDSVIVNYTQPEDDMFLLMMRAIMDDIAGSINHFIIPKLIDWNFNGGKYPTFSWGELSQEQKEGIAKVFDRLSAGQPNVTPEFMRELEKKMAAELGLDIDYDEVEKREEEDAKLLAQQQLAMAAPAGQTDPNAVVADNSPEGQIAEFERTAALSNTSLDEDIIATAQELLGGARDHLR